MDICEAVKKLNGYIEMICDSGILSQEEVIELSEVEVTMVNYVDSIESRRRVRFENADCDN